MPKDVVSTLNRVILGAHNYSSSNVDAWGRNNLNRHTGSWSGYISCKITEDSVIYALP
jgi:hypothetical protein